MDFRCFFSSETEGVACLEEDAVKFYSDDDIKQVLSKNVFLTSGAAKVLQERGFGEHIGVTVRDYIPVNMINAGIGGTTAKSLLSRIKDQVLSHNPDLVIVCFGLNDINGSLEDYTNSLKTIFEECKRKGADVIFMTPNTLNSYVAKDTDESLRHYASVTAEMQNNGKMDKYIQSAVELAFKSGIKVCDCYSAWKKLSKTQDTTMLLANRINHPKSEMHELFAEMLFETIFDDDAFYTKPADSAMFHE